MTSSTATKANSSGNSGNRKSKKSQVVNLSETATVEHSANQEQTQNSDKGAQVIAMPQLKLQETPKQEASQLALPPLPGNRPIDPGNLQVVGTMSVMGARPIFASSIQIADTLAVSGERPIAASSLQISETNMIMVNRPIASNDIDGNEDLMGYLD